ncbi:MAG: Cell division protein FtsA [Brockia lithotrophica]|uniref:Cell division protein FtsA n=1 Tax=Brockia lithotrophica TaxID=933949 RepID=A0A2T5G7I1_9BACL|nr:rod shape-determining protein [Brockia lithotrophica]PTQ52129.1 MAG: Cell division protein FtsA [Brockia lithotrophica]
MRFALDIGTQNVVGVLLEEVDQDKGDGKRVFRPIAWAEAAHVHGAMRDGQVLDAARAADTVRRVVDALLASADVPRLPPVRLAAAGRALTTAHGRAREVHGTRRRFAEQDASRLVWEALENARSEAPKGATLVGYEVVRFVLDGEEYPSLAGQSGFVAEGEVLATFLPRSVLDGLLATVERAGLEPHSITLEPLAALHAVVPSELRHLDLALVDMGAGTSDVAIVREGKIVAYRMLPLAGDELTEALARELFAGIDEAERVKREAYGNGAAAEDLLSFEDALGRGRKIRVAEVREILRPTLARIADALAELLAPEAVRPQGIFLVGGTSHIPDWPRMLADRLGLPQERIVRRDARGIRRLALAADDPAGPETVTPYAIGLAEEDATLRATGVWVNERPAVVLSFRTPTVADALLAAGLGPRDAYGPPGAGVSVRVNGEVRTFPGELGSPPTLERKGERVTPDTPVAAGDRITVRRGAPGRPRQLAVRDLLRAQDYVPLVLNGAFRLLPPLVFRRGERLSPEDFLHDGDEVLVRPLTTVGDLLESLGAPEPWWEEHTAVVDGRAVRWVRRAVRVWEEGPEGRRELPPHAPLGRGMRLFLSPIPPVHPPLEELLVPGEGEVPTTLVYVQGRSVRLPRLRRVWRTPDGRTFTRETPVEPGVLLARVEEPLPEPTVGAALSAVFSELPRPPAGFRIRIEKNGLPAEPEDPVREGDRVDLRLERRERKDDVAQTPLGTGGAES